MRLFSTSTFVCFLGNKRARKACGAWTCPSWARMKFFPDSCGYLLGRNAQGWGCRGCWKARIWTWGWGVDGKMEGRKEDAFVGLLMWSVPTHSCMHLYSPQQHAMYLSAQVSAVSQDLFSVCACVSTLLSGTETALLLYFS